jgi:hypothetical protein
MRCRCSPQGTGSMFPAIDDRGNEKFLSEEFPLVDADRFNDCSITVRRSSVPVTEHEVHPRFHSERYLVKDPEVVHVVAVDGRIARLPGTIWKRLTSSLKLEP